MKATKVPNELISAPHYNNFVKLDSVKIIESCMHIKDKKGAMFLKDHMLLFVLEGTKHINYGSQTISVHKHEMVLLKKNISFNYHKTGDFKNDNCYDCLMFFLKDEFILDFIKMAGIKDTQTEVSARIRVKKVKEPLLSFLYSIKPYFQDLESINSGLVRLKMLELLYDLASTDNELLLQLIQLKRQVVADIPQIIEDNYMNPLGLEDFAYLSGRSLSSFKRDFKSIYKVSPGAYIREKRLLKAKELIEATKLPVKEIGYETGFDSVSHFSRSYKQFFGISPSAWRDQTSESALD